MQRQGNKTLGSLLKELQSNRTKEDKFLQTVDRRFNPNASANLRRNIETIKKITSSVQIEEDIQALWIARLDIDYVHGPYNPELPQSWNLVNLNNMREELLNTRISELIRKGINIRGYNNSGTLSMILPETQVQHFSEKDLLNPVVQRLMSQG